jgi:hypothetical protein
MSLAVGVRKSYPSISFLSPPNACTIPIKGDRRAFQPRALRPATSLGNSDFIDQSNLAFVFALTAVE